MRTHAEPLQVVLIQYANGDILQTLERRLCTCNELLWIHEVGRLGAKITRHVDAFCEVPEVVVEAPGSRRIVAQHAHNRQRCPINLAGLVAVELIAAQLVAERYMRRRDVTGELELSPEHVNGCTAGAVVQRGREAAEVLRSDTVNGIASKSDQIDAREGPDAVECQRRLFGTRERGLLHRQRQRARCQRIDARGKAGEAFALNDGHNNAALVRNTENIKFKRSLCRCTACTKDENNKQ